jgi:hypothetical protein
MYVCQIVMGQGFKRKELIIISEYIELTYEKISSCCRDILIQYLRLLMYVCQRGLIYTENVPFRCSCKICNPFSHEFQVVPSKLV